MKTFNVCIRRTLLITAPLIALSVTAHAASAPKSGSFEQIATVDSPHLTMKSVDQVVFKGYKFRVDGADPDSDMAYADIDDGQSFYHYIPSQQAALQGSLKDKQQSPLDLLSVQTTQKLRGATKTSTTTIDGYSCDVYSRSLDGGAKVLLYLSKNVRFPYIIKTVLTIPQEGVTRTNSIDNIKLDVPINNSVFALPKGTKIVQAPVDSGAQGDAASGT